MARSHPPALLTLARRTLRDDHLLARGDRALVAVSGGPDSMALLHVLALLRAQIGHTLVAHGVDHGLRPEAASELDLAERFARSIDVPFERTVVRVPPGGNLQARARAARYGALRAIAARSRCVVIATAHHRDDRAETVLIRLLRGSGPRGLAVLPPRAGDLIRPFLRAPRAAIDAHIARHDVPFALDPSNRDPRFLRVRVRQELLPLLRVLSPGIDEHLCALADQLGAENSPALPPELPSLPLARASRQAIAALVSARSPTGRVPLKRGLVARWDTSSRQVTVEAAGPLRKRAPRALPAGKNK
ncbi:MAG: tRNA lysidine(34) synthetase TilS [Polyangiaceae bacterium]|jgi:tRNA(Ile)-lysidine synthase